MSHGPDDDTEFDRLMALDEADFNKEASGQQVQEAEPTPAPAAADPTPDSSGGHAAPAAGGDSGGNPADAGAPDTDWVSLLPEETQAKIRTEREQRAAELKAAEDRFNALQGRVAPTQRRLSEVETRLAHFERQQPAAPAMPPTPQPGQSLDSFYDSEDWKDWESSYPGDAKVLRSALGAQQKHWQGRLDAVEGHLQQLASRLDQTAQVVTSRTVTDEIGRLEDVHKDWRELNESDAMWAWADQWRAAQPKSLRSMYYDEAAWREMWNDADFVIARLNEYKATLAPPVTPTTTPAQTPPVAAVPTPQPASTQPVQPRDPRLALATAPDVRGAAVPPAVSTEGMDENQLFEHIWNTTPG